MPTKLSMRCITIYTLCCRNCVPNGIPNYGIHNLGIGVGRLFLRIVGQELGLSSDLRLLFHLTRCISQNRALVRASLLSESCLGTNFGVGESPFFEFGKIG